MRDLLSYRVVDISAGDTHVLALTDKGEVFAWGINAMGQCGQGHTNSPITRPMKVLSLNGIKIRQISAGECPVQCSKSLSVYVICNTSKKMVLC